MENEVLKLKFSSKGGELQSIFLKSKQREVLWKGDTKIWGRHAPVLFPIVGKLKNDTYEFNGKKFELKQHGFARDFVHREVAPGEYIFSSDDKTLGQFPFHFLLRTKYILEKNNIHITYIVENHDNKIMPFSLGAHPGFALSGNAPLRIEFQHKEQGVYYLKNGLVDFSVNQPAELVWTLKAESFKNDAMIFKNLKSQWVKLYDEDLVLTLHVSQLPYFGVWSKPVEGMLPFICLEPWWGVADTIDSSGSLLDKQGIQTLAPGESKQFSFKLEIHN